MKNVYHFARKWQQHAHFRSSLIQVVVDVTTV